MNYGISGHFYDSSVSEHENLFDQSGLKLATNICEKPDINFTNVPLGDTETFTKTSAGVHTTAAPSQRQTQTESPSEPRRARPPANRSTNGHISFLALRNAGRRLPVSLQLMQHWNRRHEEGTQGETQKFFRQDATFLSSGTTKSPCRLKKSLLVPLKVETLCHTFLSPRSRFCNSSCNNCSNCTCSPTRDTNTSCWDRLSRSYTAALLWFPGIRPSEAGW